MSLRDTQVPKTTTPREHDLYDRHAYWYDVAESCLEAVALIDPLRRRFWSTARGRLLLEVGVGGGRNFRFYPADSRVIAFDFSPSMLRRASVRAAETGNGVELLLADVNYLPFKDGMFDGVLSTFVFCAVPDPVHALSEVRRVCRQDGRVDLLEHVRPDNPLLGRIADALNVLTSRMDGENVNRDTAASVRSAGLEILREEKYRMGIVKLLQARPGSSSAGR
jgi:ubiquinone/menaquinone biosynthesis C-methylase UbiE